jgi:hypothetical protein
MQSHVKAPVEPTKQESQRPSLSSAEPQAGFEDNRPQTTQLRTLQAMASNSSRRQKLQTIQAKMHGAAHLQKMHSMQARMTAGTAAQRVEEEKPLQAALESKTAQLEAAVDAPELNNTGLPNQLKAGIESLSGMSMDHVKVHYNSDKPAQLQAHAYAQGSEIHVAPGQEQHLPHEAWHVVQQAQGRVKPTVQMKLGVPVNDDAGLEAEADVMGTRAWQLGGQTPVQRAAARPAAPHAQAVAQMRVEPVPGGNDRNTYAWIVDHPFSPAALRYGGIDMKWIPMALSAYATIADARGVVEEDEEVEHLNQLEQRLDPLVTEGNNAIGRFNQTTGFEHWYEHGEIAEHLVEIRLGINEVVGELNFYFRPGHGGFGALGRATEVGGREVVEGPRHGGPEAPDRFIADTALDGVAMTTTHHVTGGAGHAHEAGPISILVAGRNVIDNEEEAVTQALSQIPAPQAQEKAAADNFVARNRGDGQAAAMGSTNARGYAWFHDIEGWNVTRWEWLHLRGAGLGGATHGSNLVLGTRDANTQMIPYESNLRSLHGVVRESGNYTGVHATWHPDGERLRHAYSRIQMQWRAPRNQKGINAGAPEISGQVIIHPLAVGEVLSKAEVRHIEAALKEVRDSVNAEEKMEEEEDDVVDDNVVMNIEQEGL